MEHGSPTQMPEPSPTQPIAISFSFKEYIYWNMETNPHLDFQQSWFIWILYLVTSNWLIEYCIGISRLATCVKPNPSFLNFWGSTFVEWWGKRPFWWEDSIWFTLLSLWLQKHDEMNPGRLSPSHLSSEPNWNFSADQKCSESQNFPAILFRYTTQVLLIAGESHPYPTLPLPFPTLPYPTHTTI